MYEKLAFLEEQFEELSKKITNPEIIADIEKWQKLMKEHASLTPIVEKYREYKKAADTVKESEEMLKTEKDPDFCELLTSEINENRDILPKLEEELRYCFFRKTLMMKRMLLLKYAAVPAVMKRHFLQPIFSECIQCMRKASIGKLKH